MLLEQIIPRGKRISVELGNVGLGREGETPALATRLDALSDLGTFHIGIDRKALKIDLKDYYPGLATVETNFHQIRASFLQGLEPFPDNGLAEIKSRMALAYYTEDGREIPLPYLVPEDANIVSRPNPEDIVPDAKEYTTRVVNRSYQKLQTSGCLSVTVCEVAAPILEYALRQSEFGKIKVKHTRNVNPETFWTERLSQYPISMYTVNAFKN